MQDTTFARDPLGHTAPLDHQAWYPLLGVPIEVHSNSRAVIDAADHAFGGWHELDPALIEPIEPLRITLVVQPGAQAESTQPAFVRRSHSGWLMVSGGSTLMTMALHLGTGVGFVTPELVADEAQFRFHVLDQMGLALVSWHDCVAIHAAAVVHNNRAVLLLGPSGAGKSTLCYACVRDGFQLLAEDAVYVSVYRAGRLWGNPARIHLPPSVRTYFSELANVPATIQANGKLKLAVDIAAQGGAVRRHYAQRSIVCLIARGTGTASTVEPLDDNALIEQLCAKVESGFDLQQQRMRAVAHTLAPAGVFRLTVGSDLHQAVHLIRRLVEGLEPPAPRDH